jgi:hypothetical protein
LIQSIPSPPISLRSISILSTHSKKLIADYIRDLKKEINIQYLFNIRSELKGYSYHVSHKILYSSLPLLSSRGLTFNAISNQ